MKLVTRAEAREKGLTRYYTGKPCGRGHLAERSTTGGMCRACEIIRDHERQEYKTALARKQYQEKESFRLKIKERDKIQRAKYRERINAQKRRYYREVDLPARISRTLVRNVLLASLQKKALRTRDYLGYLPEALKRHLEDQFQSGMTWENYGAWHVDHIKPISAFIKEDIKDPRIINALSNLQPLWAEDNMTKGSTWNG